MQKEEARQSFKHDGQTLLCDKNGIELIKVEHVNKNSSVDSLFYFDFINLNFGNNLFVCKGKVAYI